MKCPRCGAELADSATFCSQCGTSIRPASFSYLPAGTPPWPGTVPQNYSNVATAMMQPAQKVEASSVTKVASPKPRRSVGSVLLVIAVLVLSVVVGVGGTLGILAANGQFSSTPRSASRPVLLPSPAANTGTPAATPSTTMPSNLLPTPTSFVTTNSQAVGVSLKYPGDWIEDPPQSDANSTAINFHPQQQIGIDFAIQRFSSSASAQIGSADEINQAALQSFSTNSNVHNYTEVQPANAKPMIGGAQWTERDATFANNSNIVFHAVSISVKHNNLYYNISYLAPDSVYNEAMQKYYSQMLASFQFTM